MMGRALRWGLGLAGGAALAAFGSLALASVPDPPPPGAPPSPLAGAGPDPNAYTGARRVPVGSEAALRVVRDALGAHAGLVTGRARQVEDTPAGGRAEFAIGPFVDDVEIAVVPAEDGSWVFLRSASRVGRNDLGVNAARGRALLADIALRSGEPEVDL